MASGAASAARTFHPPRTGVEHDLSAVAHVDGSQLGILLQPLREMGLIRLVSGQIVRVAKVDERMMNRAEKDGANVFRIGQIHLAEGR